MTRRSGGVAVAPPVVAAPQGSAHMDATGPRLCKSMPPMHMGVLLNAEAEAYAAGTSRSCPLLPMPCPLEAPVTGMGGGAVRRFYQPHWPEQAMEEAVKRGIGFVGKFRVNAHNRNEAYCTIDGIPVDVLVTGAAQNRAVEGDLVTIALDPVTYWTRMKGPNVACNPAIGGHAVVREVSETNGNHSLKNGQTDASCGFENCSNGLPVLDRMHYHHKNSGFSQAVKCENGPATVPESYEKDLNDGKTDAARPSQRICSMIYSHPSRRPTGKVLSIVKKSPSRFLFLTNKQGGQYVRPSDPSYEQVLDSLAMVARHTPLPLLEALLRWRESESPKGAHEAQGAPKENMHSRIPTTLSDSQILGYQHCVHRCWWYPRMLIICSCFFGNTFLHVSLGAAGY